MKTQLEKDVRELIKAVTLIAAAAALGHTILHLVA